MQAGAVDLGEVTSKPEAGQLNPSILIQQHVGRLEVAVDDGGGMQVLQADDQVPPKVVDGRFWKARVLTQQRAQVSAHAVL